MYPESDITPPGSKKGTYWLIAANTLILILTYGNWPLISRLSFIPAAYHEAHRWLTSMFLHGGIVHLAVNMWFLWIFGDNVEVAMGTWRYPLFYILCGFGAWIFTLVASLYAPYALAIPSIGASGAISGVLAAYLLMYPDIPLKTYIIVFTATVKAESYILFWFALQLLMTLLSGFSSGVNYVAHLGGFLTGLALTPLFANDAKISFRGKVRQLKFKPPMPEPKTILALAVVSALLIAANPNINKDLTAISAEIRITETTYFPAIGPEEYVAETSTTTLTSYIVAMDGKLVSAPPLNSLTFTVPPGGYIDLTDEVRAAAIRLATHTNRSSETITKSASNGLPYYPPYGRSTLKVTVEMRRTWTHRLYVFLAPLLLIAATLVAMAGEAWIHREDLILV